MNRFKLILLNLFVLISLVDGATQRPNVIVVMTDDQGYGDLGCNGNSVIQTPNIDKLRGQGLQLDNFHVDPTCAPTRAAWMTGRYSNRVGVWHTVQGRNLLRSREVTMADIFSDNGYATGIFGKWHLGDTYPFRPEDRGFQHSVYHSAGGVGQTPDYWGNDYFDDTYWVNGKLKQFEGFCTDNWFDEGIKFIKANKDKPFFAYIVPNAPHGPFYCPEEYTTPYEGNPDVSRIEFYGMVTNIDDNMAKLMQVLDDEGLAENTILIYTTDNGTAGGLYKGRGFTAGMRGQKGSQYDGGHRVPMIMRWPGGNIEAGKSVPTLTAHVDMLPTFIELCDLKTPEIEFDGTSIRALIYGDGDTWKDRSLVVESQRIVNPEKWRKCAVMTNQWRLIDGKELYDMSADSRQAKDVAAQHPEVVQRLRSDYEDFWSDVSSEHDMTSHSIIGSNEAPVVTLTSHDWLVENIPWYQPHVMQGAFAKSGHWAVEVAEAGDYEISLRRWPVEADAAINSGKYGKAFNFTEARLRVADIDTRMPIPEGAKEVTFKVKLAEGITTLAPLFISDEIETAPFYAYVARSPKLGWNTAQAMGIPLYDPTHGAVPPQVKDQDRVNYNRQKKKN